MRSSPVREIVERVLLGAVLLGMVVYLGDYLSVKYRIPNNREPLGTVQVEKYYAVKQKDGKLEYYFDQAEPEECVQSLFPHFGDRPCWYVTRHKKKRLDL